jgi:folate-binding protein YgfZ
VVTSLQPGDGNYAFAINVTGRTLFDLNILVADDRCWLDIDVRWIEAALAHLNKYIIVEDVQIADVSADWARFEALGNACPRVVAGMGMAGNFGNWASLQHAAADCAGIPIQLVRHDLGPIKRAEFLVPRADADRFWQALAEQSRGLKLVELDGELREMIRLEAGVPESVSDIDSDVIPPETLQVERGISYVKGCYLGQEVIERMRSRGSMARRLVGLRLDGDRLPEHGAPIFAGGKEVGRVTSACHSVALGGAMGLGYVKTVLVDADQALEVALDDRTTTPSSIIEIPLAIWRA